MFALQEIIEKSLLLKKSTSSPSAPSSNAFSKAFLPADLPSETTKRWNQAIFGYFDFYLDKTHGKSEIVLVRKNGYYKNVVIFI